MPLRVQELIHTFEEGTGSRFLKLLLASFVMIAAAVAYDLAAFRNLSTREGMDVAQLAWNISQGRGFTTYFIRPFSVHLLENKALAARPEPTQAAETNSTMSATADSKAKAAHLDGTHPDLANAPVYPLLLAGIFKVIQMTHPNLALQQAFKVYQPDLVIAIVNQALFVLLGGFVFVFARRLFDEAVAWASAATVLGAELFWRFSLSGLSTILLMLIFVALIGVLARLEPAIRDGNRSQGSLLLLATVAGALTGLAGLTRYSFAWLIIPVVLWLTSLAGARRANLALAAFGAFLVIMGPWLARNYNLCGAPFGTAGYALFENTPQFTEDQLERSLEADFSGVTTAHFWEKLISNGREILQNELPKMGGSWVSAFFLVGLLVPFRNATLNRVRWFLLLCLGVLVVVEALGRTSLTNDTPVHSENLLVVLAPIMFIYGISLFFTLFERIATQFPPVRFTVLGIFYLAACAPLLLVLLPPYPSPLVYPPYYPPWIQEKGWTTAEQALIMSDLPWAVAWYGQRQSIELPLKYQSKPSERLKNDFYAVDALRPVNALYLSSKSLKNIEVRSLWDWLQRDTDATVLNKLRQRLLENQGREEKREEDAQVFEAVRQRLLANAQSLEEQGENWEHFVLRTYLKSEVPTGFPLRRAPEGVFPEIFLTDSERGEQKAIQSRK